jgi:MerR family transcriptional regulator, redox-sensitive transcriptional activator SoxR
VAGDLAISDVARVFGLRTSAIRYYEQVGILPPPMRKNGQRRYDNSALFRLAVVQRARETGFTLEEIRELFFGFPERWHQLSQRKLAELRERMKRLKLMETLLKRVENCHCDALDECGEKILEPAATTKKQLPHPRTTAQKRKETTAISATANRILPLLATRKSRYRKDA